MRFNSNSETLMNLMFPLYEETIKENKNIHKSNVKKKHYERIMKQILKDITSAHIAIEKIKNTTVQSVFELLQHKQRLIYLSLDFSILLTFYQIQLNNIY